MAITLQHLKWKIIQCRFDRVELFDGRDNSSARLSKSCGSSLPSPVYSSASRYMYMQFKSDSSVTDKGFVAHYRELSDSSEKGQT